MNVYDVISEQRQRAEYIEDQTEFLTECTAKYGKHFILKFFPAFSDFIASESTLNMYVEQLKKWSEAEGETMIMYFDIWAGFQLVEKLEKDGILTEDDRMPEAEARSLVMRHING